MEMRKRHDSDVKESPYNLDNSLGKSPGHVPDISSLREDSKEYNSINRSKRKRKTRSKKKDSENQ